VLRPFPLLLLVALLGASCNSHRRVTPIGQPARGHASYALGWKGKDSSWDGAEDEFVFGMFDFDARLPRSSLWFTGKILFGTADEPDYVTDPDADASSTSEFAFGLRKYTILGPVEPYLSAGAVILYGSITGDDDDGYYYSTTIDSEVAFGGYADAGFHVPLSPYWGIGLQVHYSYAAEQELEGEDVQLGGTSVLFTIGGRW